jgi:hypothetical protein
VSDGGDGLRAMRERLARLCSLVDELIDENRDEPSPLFIPVRNKQSLEGEWRWTPRPEPERVRALVDELVERAAARELCPHDWLDDPARGFARERCPLCDGAGVLDETALCACVARRPDGFERALRMLALPPSRIVAQERIARQRFDAGAVVYVPRFEHGERLALGGAAERAMGLERWVVRPDPPMVGVRWPRVVDEEG